MPRSSHDGVGGPGELSGGGPPGGSKRVGPFAGAQCDGPVARHDGVEGEAVPVQFRPGAGQRDEVGDEAELVGRERGEPPLALVAELATQATPVPHRTHPRVLAVAALLLGPGVLRRGGQERADHPGDSGCVPGMGAEQRPVLVEGRVAEDAVRAQHPVGLGQDALAPVVVDGVDPVVAEAHESLGAVGDVRTGRGRPRGGCRRRGAAADRVRRAQGCSRCRCTPTRPGGGAPSSGRRRHRDRAPGGHAPGLRPGSGPPARPGHPSPRWRTRRPLPDHRGRFVSSRVAESSASDIGEVCHAEWSAIDNWHFEQVEPIITTVPDQHSEVVEMGLTTTSVAWRSLQAARPLVRPGRPPAPGLADATGVRSGGDRGGGGATARLRVLDDPPGPAGACGTIGGPGLQRAPLRSRRHG